MLDRPQYVKVVKTDDAAIDIWIDPRFEFTPDTKARITEMLTEFLYTPVNEHHVRELIRGRVLNILIDAWHRGNCRSIEVCFPVYQHDCESCTFLGNWMGRDLYYCSQHGNPTVIARYGNQEYEYVSGLYLVDYDMYLWAARILAMERGLLDEEK